MLDDQEEHEQSEPQEATKTDETQREPARGRTSSLKSLFTAKVS